MKSAPGSPATARAGWLRAAEIALLVCILAAAAILRLRDINWDEYQHTHPDERFIVWVASTVSWPSDLAAVLDPDRSPLNPFRWPEGTGGGYDGTERNYAYGHFPLYLLVAAAHAGEAVAGWLGATKAALPAFVQPVHTMGKQLASYDGLPLVGRAISALADLGTLLLVYALARRLLRSSHRDASSHPEQVSSEHSAAASAERRISSPGPSGSQTPALAHFIPVLAAAAYAFAVLPVQLSHFVSVDALLTFCIVAAVGLAAAGADSPRGFGWGRWLLAGAMTGLAVGSKFSAVMLAVPLLIAALYGLPGSPARKVGALAGRLAAAAAAAVVVFVLTNPFAVIEFPAYLRQIMTQNAMVNGSADVPYTRQYIGTAPYWYFIRQLSQWGLGWPLGAVAWGGLVWALVRLVRRKASPLLVVMLAWAIPYFAATGLFHAKFIRYMAPLLPFLLVFAAGLGRTILLRLARRWRGRGQAAWAVAAAVVALCTAGWALAFQNVYTQEHPWIQASRWIYENIPADKVILHEHWDDSLPLTLDGVRDRPKIRYYEHVDLPMYDPDSSEKLEILVAELSAADYLVLASNRLHVPIQRLGARYPMSSQYYRLLFTGKLGYRQVAGFQVYPSVAGVTIRDDAADESFTVYDHPRAIVFENTDRLEPDRLRTLLERYLPLGYEGRLDLPAAVCSPEHAGPGPFTAASLQPTQAPGCHPEGVGPGPLTAASLQRRISSQPDASLRSGRPPGKASYRADARRDASEPAAEDADGGLLLDRPVESLPVVADFRWNAIASHSPPLAVFLWWLVLGLAGWAAWPLLFPVLGRLADRGYGLARAAGWLLVGWIHWLGVSLGLWQNRTWSLGAVLAALVLAGFAAGWLQRRKLADFWRSAGGRRWLPVEEGLFAAAFLALVGVRLLNPDLWQPWNGGEKFMESAFLNAILRSAHFPPYDPYFAGGIINYYYYGLYLVSLPIKLTGIFPEVAFNLAVPGLYAMTAIGVFSAALSLAGRARGTGPAQPQAAGQPETAHPSDSGRRPGLAAALAVLLTLVFGNLQGVTWLGRVAGPLLRGEPLPLYDYWAASRVIPYTINEFPLWTFVFADLHPHMISMPFGILVVGAVLHWMLVVEAGGGKLLPRGLNLLLIALGLGAVGAINTWDLPTYALLALAASCLAGWRAGRLRGLAAAAAAALLAIALALAAFLPFHLHYQPRLGGSPGAGLPRLVGISQQASPFGAWLAVWGLFLAIAAGVLALAWRARRPPVIDPLPASPSQGEEPASPLPGREGPGEGERAAATEPPGAAGDQQRTSSRPALRGRVIGMLLLVGLLAVLAAVGRPTFALAALLACAAAPLLLLRRSDPAGNVYAGLLLVIGLGVIGLIEVFYLRDFLDGGDWRRMNTLFKFSVPAWLLLGLACSVLLTRAWRAAAALVQPGCRVLGAAWQTAVVLLAAASLVFAAVGVPARIRDRFPGATPRVGTLDGTAYMTVGSYTWPDLGSQIQLADEHDAIHWLLDNVTGTPVIAEAPAASYDVNGEPVGYDYYRAGGLRVSSLTGLPTFAGQHQYEQRPGEQVGMRIDQGKEFFTTTDIARARSLMADLRVRYVYVGRLERLLFGADSLRKFEVMVALGDLETAYRNPGVVIYRVRP